jgi:hypothetical protein
LVIATKAGFSAATAYRIEHDPRLPSQKKAPRIGRRRDPLAAVWDSEVVPLLQSTPGLRPIAIFDEIRRRHPEIGTGIRRTLERRIPPGGHSTVLSGTSFSGRSMRRAGSVCPISPTCAIAASASLARRSITASTTFGWPSRAGKRHGADPQQSRRGARERLDRKPPQPSQAGHRGCPAARGSRDFDTLDAYRRFVDEVVGRRNARNKKCLDLERPALQALPARRTADYEEAVVTSTSGFSLKKVFYSVPSRLIGHRLRVRLYDDRLECFLGATALMMRRRGRPHRSGKRGHVVDYRHVIHALRRKPMALLNLVYREQLFPRRAYQRAFEALLASEGEKRACRTIVGLLALPHDRAREAELAAAIEAELDAGRLPDLDGLGRRFAPDPAAIPDITVELAPLHLYDELGTVRVGEAA